MPQSNWNHQVPGVSLISFYVVQFLFILSIQLRLSAYVNLDHFSNLTQLNLIDSLCATR